MPVAKFAVTVRSVESGSNEALADAGRYLAYTDQTDLFGYHGSIDDTDVHLDDGTWYITIRFSAPVAKRNEIERWNYEMAQLSRVEEYECVSNPMTESVK